jgi:hypothetical protein
VGMMKMNTGSRGMMIRIEMIEGIKILLNKIVEIAFF